MKLYNSTQNIMIADDVNIADSFALRSIGLLSKKVLHECEGLIIKPCCSIHTFFMKFSIDVLFVNKDNKIVALYENVSPWRVLPIHITSWYVVELPADTITSKNITKGDLIQVSV